MGDERITTHVRDQSTAGGSLSVGHPSVSHLAQLLGDGLGLVPRLALAHAWEAYELVVALKGAYTADDVLRLFCWSIEEGVGTARSARVRGQPPRSAS